MGKLIEQNYDKHTQLKYGEKTSLTWEMVRIVQEEYGGRFLEQLQPTTTTTATTTTSARSSKSKAKAVDDFNKCKWQIVNKEVARKKVAYGFRTIKKMRKEKQEKEAEQEQLRNKYSMLEQQHHTIISGESGNKRIRLEKE